METKESSAGSDFGTGAPLINGGCAASTHQWQKEELDLTEKGELATQEKVL